MPYIEVFLGDMILLWQLDKDTQQLQKSLARELMMHKIYLIASAIATQEYGAGLNAARNNNPGNLRAAPNALSRPKSEQGFVEFATMQEGIATLYWQILYFALRGFTLRGLIEAWAPPAGADGGNATATYLADVQKWTGLDLDKKLWDYLEIKNAYLGLS
jgi:hypothetical protein